MELDYRFQARFTDSIELGPVDGGLRIDNYFDGRMTEGALTGARVRGVDQVRIRDDASVVLDIRETIETEEGAISADVRGYAIPDPGAPHLHTIHGFALFTTAVPEYADYEQRRRRDRRHRRHVHRLDRRRRPCPHPRRARSHPDRLGPRSLTSAASGPPTRRPGARTGGHA